MDNNLFIAIAGNIAAGKTTLACALGKKLNMEVYEESVKDNPYLKPYYESLERFEKNQSPKNLAEVQKLSYNLQRFFLLKKVLNHDEIIIMGKNVIQDRTVYEDNLFATNACESGLMLKENFWDYELIYKSLVRYLKSPDLLVYLKATVPVLKERILKRGRKSELRLADEDNEYLDKLNVRYNGWFEKYDLGPKMMLNSDEINLVDNQEHLEAIVDNIMKIESVKKLLV